MPLAPDLQADGRAAAGPVTRPGWRLPTVLGRVDAVLALVVVAGIVVRFWGLGTQSLWYDEWLTSEAVSGSLPDVFRHVANREGIPPTYFVATWGWVRIAGDGEVALRSASAVFGAATVPVAYAIAGELEQRPAVRRMAALLVAVNPMLVWYSQEARPYSLVAFLGSLSVLFFVRAWRRGERRDVVAWAVVAACMVAVHYFAVFLVVVEGLALLGRRPREWRRLLPALPTGVVLAAMAPIAAAQHSHAANRLWITEFPLSRRLEEAGRSALVGPNPPDDGLWLVVAVVVGLAGLLLLVRSGREARSAAGLAAGIGAAAVILPLVLAVGGIEDVVVGRYLIASLVPLVVAVAVGLGSGPRWLVAPAVAVVSVVSLVVVTAVHTDPHLQKPDWDAVAAAVEAGTDDRALVLNVHGNLAGPLLHYVDASRRLGDDTTQVDEIDVLYAASSPRPCNFLVGRACALLFLGAPPPEPLAGRLTHVETIRLDQFVIERYRPDDGPVTISTSDVVALEQLPNALVVAPDG